MIVKSDCVESGSFSLTVPMHSLINVVEYSSHFILFYSNAVH